MEMDNSEITNIEKLAKKADWSAIVDATTNVYDNIDSASAQLLATAATNCLEAMLKLTESGEMGEEQMLRKMPQLAALLKKLKSDDPALYKSEAKKVQKRIPDIDFEEIILMGEMNFDYDGQPETNIEEQPNYQILKILAENGSQKFTADDFEQIYFNPNDGTHACFSAADLYYDLDCFPLDEGGYAAILDIAEVEHTYCTYVFRDGTLTPTDNLLPKPTLDDFFTNAKEFPKLVYDALVKSIKSNSYWYVYSADEETLTAKLSLIVNDKNKWLVWQLEPQMPEIPYVWNGSQFVMDSEYQPTKQDTKIFTV